jgi:hypothetical protein
LNQTWERAILRAIPLVDVVLIDITDLRRASGLEREIQYCRQLNKRIVFTSSKSAFVEAGYYKDDLLVESPNLVLWALDPGGRIVFAKDGLRSVVSSALPRLG